MNDKLAKWGTPFECPSITAQLGESRTIIIQKAKVAKLGDNGNINVDMQQNPQIIYQTNITGTKETLHQWLKNLPPPRWNSAKKEIAQLAMEICCGNQIEAAKFLGRSRRVINYNFSRKDKIKELTGDP